MEKSEPNLLAGARRWPLITKGGWRVEPNMVDYQRTREKFSWEAARHDLNGLPGGKGLNIAHEAVVVSIHEKTGVDVPERDYPKVTTVNGAVAYLLAQGA